MYISAYYIVSRIVSHRIWPYLARQVEAELNELDAEEKAAYLGELGVTQACERAKSPERAT